MSARKERRRHVNLSVETETQRILDRYPCQQRPAGSGQTECTQSLRTDHREKRTFVFVIPWQREEMSLCRSP